MNFSQRVSNVMLALYKNINQTQILNHDWAQSTFLSSYFVYKKYFEDATAKLIKNYPLLFQNGHILDIGANIGYTSYVFSKALTPPYQVFAFEPEERNVKILKKAASTYRFVDSLVITAAAVGDKEGIIELWRNESHHADHRVLTDELRKQLTGSIETQKTPIVTIDSFLKTQHANQPIAFIKIDVQGYELAVCEGMQNTLASNPDCVVGLEYCPSIMEALGYRTEDLIQFFQNRNYLLYRINKNGSLKLLDPNTDPDIKQGKNFAGYFDILCSRKKL